MTRDKLSNVAKRGMGSVYRRGPLIAAALARRRQEAKRRKQFPSPWLFHDEHGHPILSFYKAWKAACERANVPGQLFHDLRRSAVRNVERAGIPRSVAMKISGHKTEAVYRRYAIVNEQDIAEAGWSRL